MQYQIRPIGEFAYEVRTKSGNRYVTTFDTVDEAARWIAAQPLRRNRRDGTYTLKGAGVSTQGGGGGKKKPHCL